MAVSCFLYGEWGDCPHRSAFIESIPSSPGGLARFCHSERLLLDNVHRGQRGCGVSPAVVLTVRRFSGEQRARCSASLIKSEFHYECRVSAALNYVLPRHRSELIILSAPTRDEMSSGLVIGQGKQAKVLRRRELQRLLY